MRRRHLEERESAEDSPKLGPRWVRPHNLAA